MEKKFNFVYLTTNLINGKQYVGDHSTDNLEDQYLGSGKYFLHALYEHGRQYFDIKILEFFNTKQEAFNAQEKYINEYNTLVPNGYNISPKGGHRVSGCFSEETKQKISETLKNLPQEIKNKRGAARKGKKFSDESRKKLSEAHKGQIPWNKGIKHTEETKKKISLSLSNENHPNWGKELKKETKQRISENNKGKHNIKHTEETKKKISKNHAKINLGKKLSEEIRKKMSESKKGIKRGNYNKQK